jgi:prophage DNA circulation protein
MTWRDDLFLEGKGSFRDVEFFVRRADRSSGRRTVTHEFPGRDQPMVEDLGEAARNVSLEAYVIGPDYMVQRNRLWQAFREPGPGPLVHPYWGRMTVTVVGKIRISETTEEGGMARFTLTVVEGGEDVAPSVTPDTEAAVEQAADEAVEALTDDLEEEWTVTGVIEAVRDAAQALIDGVNGVTSVLNQVKGKVNAVMNIVDEVGDSITALGDAAASLILLPRQLASSIQEIAQDLNSSVDSVTDAWDSYFTDDETAGSIAGTPETSPIGSTPATGSHRGEVLMTIFRDGVAYGSEFLAVDETTPQREAEAGNQDAMTAFMRGVSTIEACRSAAKIPFGSYNQAVAVRDELAEQLDLLIDVANDISYNALVELRSAVTRHLTNASADLPRVISYTPATALPALVIAHQLYGNSKRDIDIIDRNDLRNPCIVGGGTELEVLSNV